MVEIKLQTQKAVQVVQAAAVREQLEVLERRGKVTLVEVAEYKDKVAVAVLVP